MRRQYRETFLKILGTAISLLLIMPITAFSGLEQEISLMIPGPEGVQLKMRLIPAGTFMMGSPEGEAGRQTNEGPQHQVTISRAFYMGIFEVTQEQWAAVMGTYPVKTGYLPNNPVTNVSWEDCQKFVAKINTMGIGTFRLPTEAEWEYACRAGSSTRFYFGDDLGYGEIGGYAWCDSNSNETTHPIGLKKPNGWGLYDIHGNVYEWCSDLYGAYESVKQIDPQGPSSGSYHVRRSGSWMHSPESCRSAFRTFERSTYSSVTIGFRLVRTAP